LFSQYPLLAIGGPNGHENLGGSVPPRLPCGIAIHKCRQTEVLSEGESFDDFSGIDFQSAVLARGQEHQVEADM
jgi:hypothetical protein